MIDECDAQSFRCFFGFGDLCSAKDGCESFFKTPDDDIRQIFVCGRQEGRQGFDHRNVTSQGGICCSQFKADVAAADDKQGGRNVGKRERVR